MESNVIAKVDGDPIYESEIDILLNDIMKQNNLNLEGEKLVQFKKQYFPRILNEILQNVIIQKEVNNRKIEVDDNDIEQVFQENVKRTGSEETFKNALVQAGITEELFRKQIKEQLGMSKLFLTITKDITKPNKSFFEKNINQFKQKEQISAQHILLSAKENMSNVEKSELRLSLSDILGKAKRGEDFATLAKTYSDCPSKEHGGDLGSFGRGQMVPEFEKAAFDLEPNEISDIVETQFGYHIIKVNKKTNSVEPNFEEINKTSPGKIVQLEKNVFFGKWLDNQIEEKVEFMDTK